MVVQHNLQAMNANRMLGINAKASASSTEKLSSGYRINRAADDAAGLAISEKMRKQMRGLTRASLNAEDGISSVQTAEGALAEVQDMLQRMNELAVQAANGTNSKADRQYIQDEIDQLVSEIDRVAETTKFNDTYLLKGDEVNGKKKTYIVDYSVSYTANQVSNSEENLLALDTKVNYTGSNNVYMVDKKILSTDSSVAMSADVIGTGDDITPYMIKDGYKPEYSFSLARPNEATDIKTTTKVSASYIADTSVTIPIKTDGTAYTVGGNSKSLYTLGGTVPAKLSDFMANVDVTLDASMTPTFKWKTPAPQYYFDIHNITPPFGTQTDLVDDAELDAYLKAALAANDICVATGGLYKTDAPNINDLITDDELDDYFDLTVNGYYSGSTAPSAEPAYAYVLDPSDPDFGQRKLVGATDIGTFVNHQTITYTDGLYTNNTLPLTLATEQDLENCLSTIDGSYTGGLYVYDKSTGSVVDINTVDDPKISDYVKTTKTMVEDPAATPENNARAQFDDSKYAAFVTIELNSTVATGSSGSVNGDAAYDLSTNGITDVVRANKDLYIYNRSTKNVTHLSAGDDISAYLNDDNTVNDKYALLGVLDSSEGTSDAVKKQLLGSEGAENFKWDNSYIERDASKKQLYDVNGKEVSGMALNKFFDENGNYKGGLYTTSQARVIDQVFTDGATYTQNYINVSNALRSGKAAVISDYINIASTEVSENLNFDLQVGADSARENKLTVDIASLTAAGLGIDKLHSDNIGIVDETGDNATDAIDVIAEALQRVSTQRSALGAIQNRLEHTIKNLDNVVENTTAAESQIRDTDMATEMVKYSNNNILLQAGQSMLSQANQANQGVLSLLQ